MWFHLFFNFLNFYALKYHLDFVNNELFKNIHWLGNTGDFPLVIPLLVWTFLLIPPPVNPPPSVNSPWWTSPGELPPDEFFLVNSPDQFPRWITLDEFPHWIHHWYYWFCFRQCNRRHQFVRWSNCLSLWLGLGLWRYNRREFTRGKSSRPHWLIYSFT